MVVSQSINQIIYFQKDNKNISIIHKTKETHFIGHGGFFQRTTEKYDLEFVGDKMEYLYDEISISKDGKKLIITSGFLKFTGDNKVIILINIKDNEKILELPINGTYKLE